MFGYDPMGRTIKEWQCAPSTCAGHVYYETDAAYNFSGNMTSLTYPSGRHITNSYNAGGGLAGVTFTDFNGTAANYPYVTAVSYGPTGAVKALTYGNGVGDTVDYNNRLQPSNLLTSGGGQTFSHKTYNWSLNGNNGNVWGINDALNNSRNQSFGYDTLNRLTSAQADSFNQTYSYDAFGNLTQHGSPIDTSGFSFNSSNQMTGGSIVYDVNGNMTKTNTGQILIYNAENQVTSVNIGAVANYTYSPEGERIRKDLPAGAFTEYMYFGGNVIGERNQAGDWTDYVYANGTRIAKADSFENGIMIQGTNCSNCGTQHTWFTVNDAQYLSGYTVESGDKLYFRQYQANARGGMGVFFRDGTNNVWNAVDQNGQYTNDDPRQQVWDQRSVDLSNYAGKVIDWIGLVNDNNSPGGAWAIIFGDIALVSADGAVHGIYNDSPNFSVTLAFANSGVTGVTVSNRHLSNVGSAAVSTTEYYHEDHLGTSRLMTSYGGWPVWQGTFSPFGQEINREATTNHYKFTGKERDEESGLDYFGARYYGSNIGRFITPDWSEQPDTAPYANLGDPQSFNLYSYARNNPLSNEDLDGHACVSGEDGKFHDDNNGGESCADVDHADKNIPASATVNANTPQPSIRELAEQDGIRPGFLGPADVFFIRMPEFGIMGRLGRLLGFGERAIERGGLAPVLKGVEGVEKAIAEVETEGGSVLGREITVKTAIGRVRVDFAYRDASGKLILGEAKNGVTAALNSNQAKVFEAIKSGGGTVVGNNGAKANILGNIGPTEVRVFKY